MSKDRRQVLLGASQERFPEGTHICLIYDDREREKILGKFLGYGLAEDERVGYFHDESKPTDVQSWVTESGIKAHDGNCVQYNRTDEIYFPTGTFTPAGMLATVRKFYEDAIKQNYAGARGSGEMGWALRGIPGSDRLIEYEALLNPLLEEIPITVICQYDARKFSGATLLNVLRVHPMMVVSGQVVRNPYYVPTAAKHTHC